MRHLNCFKVLLGGGHYRRIVVEFRRVREKLEKDCSYKWLDSTQRVAQVSAMEIG